jgi:hypothetical protein
MFQAVMRAAARPVRGVRYGRPAKKPNVVNPLDRKPAFHFVELINWFGCWRREEIVVWIMKHASLFAPLAAAVNPRSR